MSYAIAAPEALASVSGDLTAIEDAIRGAAAAAAPSTMGMVAAAGDEVSAAITRLFGGYAQEFQALGAEAAQFHAQFVGALSAGGATYAAAEASNVSLLVQGVQQQFFDRGIFSPFIYLTGKPLFGKASVGPAVTGTTGPGLGGRLLTGLFNGSLGSGSGVFQGTGTPSGVTGVREGFSYLNI